MISVNLTKPDTPHHTYMINSAHCPDALAAPAIKRSIRRALHRIGVITREVLLYPATGHDHTVTVYVGRPF